MRRWDWATFTLNEWSQFTADLWGEFLLDPEYPQGSADWFVVETQLAEPVVADVYCEYEEQNVDS